MVVTFSASSSIGRETALQFAQRGAGLIVVARDEIGLGTLIEQIALTTVSCLQYCSELD